MAYAIVADVAERWRPITDPAEQIKVGRWLEDASLIVRVEVPNVDARIASGDLSAELVTLTVAEMVKRRLENPDGARSVTTQTGPFMHVRNYGRDIEPGIFLTRTERDRLDSRPMRRRAFSLDLTPGA